MEIEERVEAPTGEQVQGDSPAAPESKPPAATEPDYKTELASAKQQLVDLQAKSERLEAQLNGARGTISQRRNAEIEQKRTWQELGDVKEIVKALVEAQTDDPEHPARKTLRALETRSEEQRAQALISKSINADWSDIVRTVARTEGMPLASDGDVEAIAAFMQQNTTWQTIYNQVAEGNTKANTEAVRKALNAAYDLADDVKEKRHKAELADVQKKAKEDVDNRVHDEFIKRGLLETANPKAAGVPGKGRKPTAQEVHDATPEEYAAKKKSGEWLL